MDRNVRNNSLNTGKKRVKKRKKRSDFNNAVRRGIFLILVMLISSYLMSAFIRFVIISNYGIFTYATPEAITLKDAVKGIFFPSI